jgi:hypothetical protein
LIRLFKIEQQATACLERKVTAKSRRMTEPRYSWQSTYSAVIAETNLDRLQGKIYVALAEIEQRRLSPIDAEEAKTLAEAELVLRLLQTEPRESFGAQ